MSSFTKTFPNPLAFTALINGMIGVALSVYLGVRIYPYDYPNYDDFPALGPKFCERKQYPMPIAAMVGSLVWLGYFLVAMFRQSPNTTITHHDKSTGLWRRPIGFFICAIIGGLIPTIVFLVGGLADFCGENTDLGFYGLFLILILICSSISTPLLFITRDRISCIEMTPIRYICGLYPLAPFTMFIWIWKCIDRSKEPPFKCPHHQQQQPQQQELASAQLPQQLTSAQYSQPQQSVGYNQYPQQSQPQHQQQQYEEQYYYEQQQQSQINSNYADSARSPIYGDDYQTKYGNYTGLNL